jgi:hypothetical protein
LINAKGLDLGIRANGERVDDIMLPRWADTPKEFLEKHREALECDYVSKNLHFWIDLIFGKKQRSIEEDNLFHPLTYEGCVDLELIEDPFERLATEQQINEFGQTPRQLFRYDHPTKFSNKPIAKSLFIHYDEIVGSMKLPNKISINTTEEIKNYEPVIVEKYREIGITDDYRPKKRESKNEFDTSVSDTKAPSEESKHNMFEIDNHEIDSEPIDSFLKRLKYDNMESMGQVHNDEIMEVNAIVHKSGETHLMIVSKDGLIKLFQEEKTSDLISERYAQKRSFFVSEQGILCS